MKVIILENILFLCSLFSLIDLYPVVAANTHSGSGGARHSSSDHENLLMLARVAVPSNHETGGSNGGAGSHSRSRSQMSSSVSQGSHRSTSLGRHISREKSVSPRPAPVIQHQHSIHHQSEAQSSRLSPVVDRKGKRPRSPSPSGRIASPDRSPKNTVKLFGKVIHEETSSKSPSPKRQASGNSPTLRLFGKDISSSPPKAKTAGGGVSSLFGIDLKKEAAKGKQTLHTSTPRNSPGNSGSNGKKHNAGSPNKSPVINLDSDSEGDHVRRRSESPMLPRHRGDTPESQRTDASFQYSEDSGYGAKSALSRRMPTQMLGQFSTKSQRHATSVRGQNHPPQSEYPQGHPGANQPGNHPGEGPHNNP